MLHGMKAYVGWEIQWFEWQIVSIEPLKVEGQNGNFFNRDALVKKGLQEVEHLSMTWMEF